MSSTGFSQRPELKQSQKLAPQMQQSLQILQAATLELRTLVQQELNANPVLEDETSDISIEDQNLNEDDEGFEEEFSKLSQMDDEWREYMAQSRKVSQRSAADEEKRQFMFDSLVRPVTLQESLLEQLSTEGIEEPARSMAEMLIGNLDENGFLQIGVEELSLSNGIPLEDLVNAKSIIQSFEPAGVGAESLGECLIAQLERSGKPFGLEYRIINDHLPDLAKRRFPQIAKKLGVTAEQVSQAAETIGRLDPKPGRLFESGDNRFITPDVFVEVDEDGNYQIRLNNEQVPRLRISNTYKDMMAEKGDQREVRSYIKDKIRSGRSLIQSIQQRQDTIRRIAGEIVIRQVDFFDKGRAHLHPMNMAQVAEAVGVHETTVSRAIAGKFISTPQGVLDMKFFFTTGYQTDSGESVANTSVKDTIAEIVAEEDPHKPLSDQAIVKALEEKGIKIARRTVAKYREELDILPSHMRKSYS
tara:strand:- start:20453 stop:21871 length:1419 start_codon:yes stop_codon:yes gene_type:complete